MKYCQELSMAAFCVGAILFYYLLYKSEIVPRVLSLWGLLAVMPCLVATVSAIFDTELPFLVYLPYVPFEFFIGVWILIRGIPGNGGAPANAQGIGGARSGRGAKRRGRSDSGAPDSPVSGASPEGVSAGNAPKKR
jgi:hypothetical protein